MIDDEARKHLLVGVDNKLLLQDLVDVFHQPQTLYEDNNKSVVVTGIPEIGLFLLLMPPDDGRSYVLPLYFFC